MRRWLSVILLVLFGVGLTACEEDGSSSSKDLTLDQQMVNYRVSLQAEADWLWNNMLYTRDTPWPDAEHCIARTFTHEPVIMDENARMTDVTAAKLIDQLNYAASLIAEAHVQWDSFCEGKLSPVNIVAFIESRLQPAYSSLNLVDSTLIQRGAPTATPIFQE